MSGVVVVILPEPVLPIARPPLDVTRQAQRSASRDRDRERLSAAGFVGREYGDPLLVGRNPGDVGDRSIGDLAQTCAVQTDGVEEQRCALQAAEEEIALGA